MNILHHICESLETIKILKIFDANTDPGIFLALDPDPGWEKFGSGIRDKPPVSATLVLNVNLFLKNSISEKIKKYVQYRCSTYRSIRNEACFGE
jgi:hypothetical protein